MADFPYNPPLEPYLDLLYQDQSIMVVNKPSGILSVPGKELKYNDSILTRIQRDYPLAAASHRLDMSTSGILVVPLTREAASSLGKQFQERSVQKLYYAWVYGKIEKLSGTIDLPIALDQNNKPVQKIDFENGRRAITEYTCLYTSDEKSFVRLKPITGRSHQLRLHMKELGHPILGDKWYGTPEIRAMAPHLYLHAGKLVFKHPTTNEVMCFKLNPPFALPEGVSIDQD